MPKKMKIIMELYSAKLTIEVNKNLAIGWELVNVFCTPGGGWCAAMVMDDVLNAWQKVAE